MEILKELLEKDGYSRWECISFDKVKSMPDDMWVLHNTNGIHEKQKGDIADSILWIGRLSEIPKKYTWCAIFVLLWANCSAVTSR